MSASRSGRFVSQIADPAVFLFSLTLFLSAALTFTIQPMIGKILLPLVGGTPSGWLVTMVYFQMALLAGYAIAHMLARLPVVTHMVIVIVLLLAGLLMFPLHIKENIIETPGLPEALRVLLALFASLTLPCVALFTLSPSLQRLFKAGSARDPYFLFAASNLGSLGGLLAYPLIIEHVSGLSTQTHVWERKYEILVFLCVACLALAYKKTKNVKEIADMAALPAIPWKMRGGWVLLAFLPSSLMLGVTAHVTSDLGSVPFFWVLPLALYLVTFILAFAQRQVIKLSTIEFLRNASIAVLMAFFVKRPSAIAVSVPEEAIFPLAAFFFTAMFCHFKLAAERPDARKLTEFYLWVAVGGALGGLFNTFVVPFAFPLPVEFIFIAVFASLIHSDRPVPAFLKDKRYILIGSLAAIGLTYMYGTVPFPDTRDAMVVDVLATVILLGSLILISFQPRLLTGLCLVIGTVALALPHGMHRLDVHRDFFGVLRVFETVNKDMTVRTMFHGSTLHGLEQVAPVIDTNPHAYYEGPLTNLFILRKPSDVAILGMGAGTILCYQASGRHYTMYEIDPAVPELAAKWFDYVRVCGTPDMRIGDGRRMLAVGKIEKPYDMLIVDVFTSDAIPIHLLTKEAFQVYFDRLKPDGLLAIHISNRFYDLRYPISNIMGALGLHGLYKDYKPPEFKKLPLTMHSQWVVIARDEAELKSLRQQNWIDLPAPHERVWTDDFSDALSALRIFQPQPEVNHAQTH